MMMILSMTDYNIDIFINNVRMICGVVITYIGKRTRLDH